MEKSPDTCRVCLRSDRKLAKKTKLIFVKHKGCLIAEKICLVADVKIQEGDGLPDKICPKCFVALNAAYNFKLTCERSNKLLLASLEKPNILTDHSTSANILPHVVKKAKEISNNTVINQVSYDADCPRSLVGTIPVKQDPEIEIPQKVEKYVVFEDDLIEPLSPDRSSPPFIKTEEPEVNDNVVPCDQEHFTYERSCYIKIKKDELPISIDYQTGSDASQLNVGENIVNNSEALNLTPQCHDCGQFFKTKCKLRVHWKKVHLSEKLVCPKCKRAFKTFKALNKHKIQNNGRCKTASQTRIEGVGKMRIFHCKKCSYSTKSMDYIKTHLQLHLGIRPYLCKLCNKSYTQLSSLHRHEEQAHKIFRVEMTCHYCGKQVKGRQSVYRHLQQHKQSEYHCDICKAVLKSRNSLIIHMKIHDGIRAYACHMCEASFVTGCGLGNHIRFVHEKKKRFKCDMCEYTSHKNILLKNHRSKHTGTNFACLVCGQFCDTEKLFEKHKQLHDGPRDFSCPHCGKMFRTPKDVGKHVRRVHKCGYVHKVKIEKFKNKF